MPGTPSCAPGLKRSRLLMDLSYILKFKRSFVRRFGSHLESQL